MNLLEVEGLETRQGTFYLRVPRVSLRAGEMVAICGPNGSGKSTFLATLAGLKPYRGSYFLEGKDFRGLPASQKYRRLAYLPQESHLRLPFEVFYVVLTGRFPLTDGRRYTTKDWEATEKILRDWDLWSLRNRPFPQLSGGEKQRVLLARVFNREAPIVLLDEPFTGVDWRHQQQILRYLRKYTLQRKALILTVMHDLALAIRVFDRFLLFQRGEMRYDCTREELQEEMLSEILGLRIRFLEAEGKRWIYTEV